jgi:hypothetical protein
MHKMCNRCGQPVIFRPYRRNPKTGQIERPVRARFFAIHLNGGCGQLGFRW